MVRKKALTVWSDRGKLAPQAIQCANIINADGVELADL